MAKVTGPLHSSEARGRVGVLVYNTWRGINYVKATKTPLTEYSDAQIYVRGLAALATSSWQALSDTQRAAWYDFANEHPETSCLGDRTRLTAYNWYIRINVRAQLLDEPIVTTPPTHWVKHIIAGLWVDVAGGHLHPRWTKLPAYSPATLYYDFWRVGPHSAGAYPTVRDCIRVGFTVYSSGIFYDASAGPGLYTYYVRPCHSNGTVGGWFKTTGMATA